MGILAVKLEDVILSARDKDSLGEEGQKTAIPVTVGMI